MPRTLGGLSLRSMAQALSTLSLVAANEGGVDVASELDHWPLPFSAACAPFDSCGNHRFLAMWNDSHQSPAPAALRVRLEWRRPSFGPAPTSVLAQLLHPRPGASAMVQNVLVHPSATRDAGDVVFDPSNASQPGVLLYWLPFSHGHTLKNGGNITVSYDLAFAEQCIERASTHWSCNNTYRTADPAWRARALADFDRLPQLAAPVYSARTDEDSFGPLEWAATTAEVSALVRTAGNRSVLPFLEPRERPIWYQDAVPHAWVERGPDWDGKTFLGARKDEHFMLQIGLLAARNTSGFLLERSGCTFTDLTLQPATESDARLPTPAVIPASALSSLNLEGMTSRGTPFTRAMNVRGGKTGVLWIGVRIPPTATPGNYSGTVRLVLQNLRSQEVIALPLTVEVSSMDPVTAHGDLDGARLTRARWLDSTLGIDDAPTERVGSLRLDRTRNAITTGHGGEVVVDETGLPRGVGSAAAQYGGLLADVVRFEAIGTNGEMYRTAPAETVDSANELPSARPSLDWNFSSSTVTWSAPVRWLRGSQSKQGLKLTVSGSMDFDGAMYFNAALHNTGDKPLFLDDVRLSLPIRRKAAPYMMGMGLQGGYSEAALRQQHSWRWSIDPHHLVRNNMVWLGDPGLGLRLKLLPNGTQYDSGEFWVDEQSIPTYSWAGARGATVQYPFTSLFFNRTTYSGGANLSIAADNQTVDVVAFSGPKVLASGAVSSFRFQLLVTPSSLPNVSAHFAQRYQQVGSPPPPLPDKAAVERFIDTEFVEPGYSVMNLHHGTVLNPYINWPLAQSSLSLQTELAAALHARGFRLKVYMTVGQISDRIEILPVLRSLDGEVLDLCDSQSSEHPTNNEESDTGHCTTEASRETYAYTHPGGYCWVQEHLGIGYVPTWTQPIGPPYTGNVDQALKNAQNAPNQLARRMENYMVAAMSHLLDNPPYVDGLYLDGISYDRVTMRRVRKVLDAARPGGVGLLDFHGGNLFDIPQTDCCHPGCDALGAVCKGPWSGATSSALAYMDLFPYLDSVMFGEWFNYGDNFGHPGEDYWLVEISGLPFGVFNDMLGSPYPTDPYKGMVFGSWARYGSGTTLYPDYHNNTALWAFIAATDLNQSSMIGYWNTSSPVRVTTGSNLTQAALCDKVFATSYVIPGVRTVLSVASWADADANCTLTVAYEQLGFTEAQSARARARGLVAQPIDEFQPAARFPSDSELPIQSSKGYFVLSGRQSRPRIQPGWLLVIEPGAERASTNG